MRIIAFAVVVVAVAALAHPTLADESEAPPEELAREGIAKLLSALEALIDSIPQYHSPEVLDNGDIIIRRKHTDEDGATPEGDKAKPAPKVEETRT